MFKRKNKKTDCETPERLQMEIEPVVIAEDCGVKIAGYANRVYKLNHGDVFTLNDVAIEQTFNISIKKVKLGTELQYGMICIEKIKRRHWWQFWKPKYRGAKFMYVEKENKNECSNH